MTLNVEEAGATRIEGWQGVADHLRDLIESGEAPVGSALPAERILCAQLGVSRSSLREAIRYLETLGYVATRHGARTRVVSTSATPNWPGRDSRVAELFEVRRIIEPDTARLAAERRNDGDLERLAHVLKEMQEAIDVGDRAGISEADRKFHELVGQASSNHALMTLTARLQTTGSEERTASLAIPGQELRALQGHNEIFEAIARQDAEQAHHAMAKHLDDAVRLLSASP